MATTAAARVQGCVRRARVGVSLMFFSNGFFFSNLAPRLPLIKAEFDLSNTAFGFLMIAGPLGSLLPGSLAARLIRRFGALPVNVAGSICIAIALSTIGWAPSLWLLIAALMFMGFSDNITDAAQNVHGLAVEDAYGKSIFNSFHGTWSLGATTGGLVGALAADLSIALPHHLTAAALIGLIFAGLAVWLARMPAQTEASAAAAADGEAVSKLSGAMLVMVIPLAALAISGVIVEDIGERWSAIYLLEHVGLSAGIAGLGYPILVGSQFIGRFAGDPLTDRFGRVAVLRSGGLMILLGGLLLVFMPHPAAVFPALALCGFGCATTVPAAYAAAGRLPGLPKGAGIALVGWGLRAGFMASSPIFGLVSDATNMQVAMALLILSGVLVTALSGKVRSRSEA